MPSHAEIRQKRCETLQCRIVMEAQTENNNNDPNVQRSYNGSQTKKSKESEQRTEDTEYSAMDKQLKYTNYTTIATI